MALPWRSFSKITSIDGVFAPKMISMSRHKLAVVLGLGIAMSAAAEPAAGHAPPFDGAPLNYAVLDQDLRLFLGEFARLNGVAVRISDAVQGRIRGRLPPLPPREVLERVATMHGLDWFYDGRLLHISLQSERGARLLPLGAVGMTQLAAAAAAAGLADPRFPLTHAAPANMVAFAGPPAFTSQLEAVLAALGGSGANPPQAAPPPTGAVSEVRVVRGRRGNAPG